MANQNDSDIMTCSQKRERKPMPDELPSFETFMLSCAMYTAQCMSLRDNPDVQGRPEMQEVPQRYTDAVVEAQTRLDRCQASDSDAATDHCSWMVERLQEEITHRTEHLKNQIWSLNMLQKIIQWIPPTPEHETLKKQALQELKANVDRGCPPIDLSMSFQFYLSSRDWWRSQIDEAKNRLAGAQINLANAKKRVDAQNAWVHDLYNSLGVCMPPRPGELSERERDAEHD
jgi:hypothetical protein